MNWCRSSQGSLPSSMVAYITGSDPNKTVEIKKVGDCWLDIPIQCGGFVSPHNWLYTSHSSKTPCSKFFPLTMEMEQGWVALMPHLNRQPAPAEMEAVQPWSTSKEDFTVAGLYSPKELK